MKKATWILLAVVVGLSWAVAAGPEAKDKQTLTGEYRWNNGGSETLTAEFKPDGDGAWKVEFRFRFSGDDYNWKGTAEGSLEDGGEVTGTATWSKSGRNWIFSGTVEDGVLSGRHAEMRGGKESPSGTFELAR